MSNTILIVVPRYNYTNEIDYRYTFPLGLGFISSVLKNSGYNVDCLNLNHRAGHISDIIKESLDREKYDYVCTGGNSLIYALIDKIIEAVREHYSFPKIIIGGPIVTSEPELIFKALKPDFAVIGEGEKTILELLSCLREGNSLEDVKGICFWSKDNNIVFTKKREQIKDLDSLPLPDFEGFGFEEQLEHTPIDSYLNNAFDYPRVYPLLGSRGCPFQCTFCYHYSSYRERSIDNIMEELDLMVKRFKINILAIYDECFAIKKDRLEEFCKRLSLLRKELPWELRWSCQMSVRSVNAEILKMMKNAGCDSISYGFESYSPIVLKSMRKPITPEQIDYAFHETVRAGINVQANFIFGDIAETIETARETLDYWKKNCQGQVSLVFIQPYPGSEIYEYCVKKGIIQDKLEFIKNELSINLNVARNMTEKMTDKEFKQLEKDIKKAIIEYREHVRPTSIKKLKRDIYSLEVKCPFCNKMNSYKNCFIPNRFGYRFNLNCRNCNMRFFVIGIPKMLYSIYLKLGFLKGLKHLYLNFNHYVKKRIT